MDRSTLSCGIDVEAVDRFRSLPGVMAHVFSPAERAHADQAQDRAQALCAAFCVKEALFKALDGFDDLRDVEFILAQPGDRHRLRLNGKLCRERGVIAVEGRVGEIGDGRMTAEMVVFRQAEAGP